MTTYNTIAEIKAANEAAGHYFFSRSTMEFFDSVVESEVINGRFFVTSEQDKTGYAWGGKRRFTVRRTNDDGTIDTVGEHGQYASKARATQAAHALEV